MFSWIVIAFLQMCLYSSLYKKKVVTEYSMSGLTKDLYRTAY